MKLIIIDWRGFEFDMYIRRTEYIHGKYGKYLLIYMLGLYIVFDLRIDKEEMDRVGVKMSIGEILDRKERMKRSLKK